MGDLDRANTTILECIYHYAEITPDKIAIIESNSGMNISYRELWDKICSGMSFLREKGVNCNDFVLIVAYSTIEFCITCYAVQLLGAVAIPIEKQLDSEQIQRYLSLFKTKHFFGKNCGILSPTKQCDYIGINSAFPSRDNLGLIMYTTGTTSTNKGVMLSLKAYYAAADNYVCAIGLSQNDTLSISVPLSHSGGLRHVMAGAIAGCTVLLVESIIFVKSVLNAWEKYHVSVLRLVPAQLSLLINKGGETFSDLNKQIRCITIGSALTPETDKEKLRNMFPDSRLFVTYGCTEASGFSHFEYSLFPPRPYCVGKAGVHSCFHIVDENGEEIESSKDNPGIVALSGENIMLGYYNDEETTRNTLINNMVITADIGYCDEEGYYYVLGRRDDIIISGGYKISPADVENAALSIQNIEDAACVGIKDDILGHRPFLYVKAKNEHFSATDIRIALLSLLESYKVPNDTDIIFIDEIPRSKGTGKILYRELRIDNGK